MPNRLSRAVAGSKKKRGIGGGSSGVASPNRPGKGDRPTGGTTGQGDPNWRLPNPGTQQATDKPSFGGVVDRYNPGLDGDPNFRIPRNPRNPGRGGRIPLPQVDPRELTNGAPIEEPYRPLPQVDPMNPEPMFNMDGNIDIEGGMGGVVPEFPFTPLDDRNPSQIGKPGLQTFGDNPFQTPDFVPPMTDAPIPNKPYDFMQSYLDDIGKDPMNSKPRSPIEGAIKNPMEDPFGGPIFNGNKRRPARRFNNMK